MPHEAHVDDGFGLLDPNHILELPLAQIHAMDPDSGGSSLPSNPVHPTDFVLPMKTSGHQLTLPTRDSRDQDLRHRSDLPDKIYRATRRSV
jgi:hypothetical protein